MKETEFYQKMIDKYAVDDFSVTTRACAPIVRKRRAWKRVLLPFAASLVLVCGTVLLIPSARAEVFRWFSATRPEEYLTADPDARVPVEALDVLIVPPAPVDTEDTVKPTAPESPALTAVAVSESPVAAEAPESPALIGAVTNNRVLQVCDEPIWQQIAADFSIELGETMFNGHDLYLSVAMKGICALPELEPYTGGNATQFRIGKENLAEFFEGGQVPEEYQNEEISAYEPMKGRFFLLLDDGSEVPFGPLHSIDIPWEELPVRHKNKGTLTDAERAEISRLLIDWLDGRELRGVLRKPYIDVDNDWFYRNGELVEEKNMLDYLLSQADENGILTGTVLYRVGTDLSGKYAVKLEAELGTASFDLLAYKGIAQQLVESLDGTVAWDAESVVLGKVGVDYGADLDHHEDNRISLYEQLVSMEGVTMTVETDEAEISALGVRNIKIRIRVPEAWTQDDREALAASLTFDVLLNGERGDWLVSPYGCALEDDGSVLYLCAELVKVPYAKLQSLQTITFVPVIRSVKAVDMQTEDESGLHHESVGILATEYGETAWSPLGVSGCNEIFDCTEFPQYAMTLTVN